MKIKWSFLFIICMVLSTNSKSQRYLGLEAGIGYNTIKTNVSTLRSTALASQVGFYFGLDYQKRLSNWIWLETVPYLIQKNYKISRTDSLLGVYSKHSNLYFQLPLMLQTLFGKKLKYGLEVGAFAGYWLCGSVEGQIPDVFSVNTDYSLQQQTFDLTHYKNDKLFDSKIDNRIEYGYTGGLKLNYDLKKNSMFFLACRYFFAVSDQQKSYFIGEIPRYNQTLTIELGMVILLDKMN